MSAMFRVLTMLTGVLALALGFSAIVSATEPN
jgi:hypothetical protein